MRDIASLYDDYLDQKEERLQMLPKCFMCDQHIQTECYYLIGGEYYCEDCVEDCKGYTEDLED